MAGDPLSFAAFTLLPILALGVGVLVTVVYSIALVDRRILLATALFVLMGFHQATELWQFLGGMDPYRNMVGELLETAVNLLAVGSIGYVLWSLETERQRREQLHLLQESTPGADERTGAGSVVAGGEDGAETARGRTVQQLLRTPVLGRVLGVLYATLPLGSTAAVDAVVDEAVRNAGITFPSAGFEVEAIPAVTVFADQTYLQEILETVLERLVVYNDASEPLVTVTGERSDSTVTLHLSDNGSGLPTEVAERLTAPPERAAEAGDLEPDYVHAFLERWGGSIAVVEGQVEITLVTPG